MGGKEREKKSELMPLVMIKCSKKKKKKERGKKTGLIEGAEGRREGKSLQEVEAGSRWG